MVVAGRGCGRRARQVGQFGLERAQLLRQHADLLAELVRGQARDGFAGGDQAQDRCRVHVARQVAVAVPDSHAHTFTTSSDDVTAERPRKLTQSSNQA
jgi:hypothetical protein